MRKRDIVIILYIIIVLLTAIIGLRYVSLYFGSEAKKLSNETYDKYYVIISDDNESSFWKSVYSGANEYGLEKNVFVEDLAASFSNDLSKEELMKIAIASNVDGILISADDSEEMRDLINEASLENIPVVTLYNDSPNSNRISYVGVGNYNIGKEYGRLALNVAQNSFSTNEDIEVVVLVNSIPSSDQMMVYSAIQEIFEKDNDFKNIKLSTVKIDSTNTFSVEETIRDIFISDEAPDIIVCLSELDTTCVYQAVIDYNKVGQVNILGYYDSDVILQGIDRNIINSTIKIDTKQMGEYCVDALLEYDKAGFTSQYFAVDIEVISADNVDEYMEAKKNEK